MISEQLKSALQEAVFQAAEALGPEVVLAALCPNHLRAEAVYADTLRSQLAQQQGAGWPPVAWFEADPSARGLTLREVAYQGHAYSTRMHWQAAEPVTSNPVWPLFSGPVEATLHKTLGDALIESLGIECGVFERLQGQIFPAEASKGDLMQFGRRLQALAPSAQSGASVPSEAAYDAGWKQAVNWAGREDLLADMESPAYRRDRVTALANVPGIEASGLEVRAFTQRVEDKDLPAFERYGFERSVAFGQIFSKEPEGEWVRLSEVLPYLATADGISAQDWRDSFMAVCKAIGYDRAAQEQAAIEHPDEKVSVSIKRFIERQYAKTPEPTRLSEAQHAALNARVPDDLVEIEAAASPMSDEEAWKIRHRVRDLLDEYQDETACKTYNGWSKRRDPSELRKDLDAEIEGLLHKLTTLTASGPATTDAAPATESENTGLHRGWQYAFDFYDVVHLARQRWEGEFVDTPEEILERLQAQTEDFPFGSEQGAFERWAAQGSMLWNIEVKTSNGAAYKHTPTNCAWAGWNARASLPVVAVKALTMGERKALMLCEKGAEPVGVVLRKGNSLAIVTDLGLVQWFIANEQGGIAIRDEHVTTFGTGEVSDEAWQEEAAKHTTNQAQRTQLEQLAEEIEQADDCKPIWVPKATALAIRHAIQKLGGKR